MKSFKAYRSGLMRKVTGRLVLLAGLMVPLSVFANTLTDVSYSALPGDSVQVVLTLEEPIDRPASFSTDNPARIVVDLADTSSGLKRKSLPIGVGMARSLNAVQAGDRTRIVLNLISAVQHSIDVKGNQVLINVAGGAGAGTMTSSTAVTAANASSDLAGAARHSVRSIDFRRGDDGEAKVVIGMSDSNAVVDLRQEGNNLVLDIIGAALPESLMRTLDVADFATPAKVVETKPQGGNVHMTITAEGDYEHLAYQTDNTYTVELRPLSKQEKAKLQKQRLVYTGDRLSLNFQDIEVRSVLSLLGDFTGLNMVVSDTVDGRITLRLKNVPWDQAMDIILKTKGLSMRRTENVVLVAPTEEIAAREKLELESQQQIEELAPLRSEWLRLNYAKAKDFAELLTDKDNPFLSERGSVTWDERTNTLLVRDTAANLDGIRELVTTLDIPVRQVMIESRIVIANNDFAKDLGVKLGLSGYVTNSDNLGNNNVFVGGGLAGDYAAAGVGGFESDGTTAPIIENPAGSGNEALLVNLPQTLSSGRGGALNFFLGKIGSHLLRLELSAMQQEGKGEVVSSPRVITSDQNQAIIKQGVEIPYQEASSSGATTVAFKEAVLKLEVTPHITPDDRIIMDLNINKDSPDFSRAILGVPPVDTRSVETSVLVDNGETVVLGGVFERNKTTSTERVPFFGDLPYVGFMFKQTQTQDENQELLIFITPKILKQALNLN